MLITTLGPGSGRQSPKQTEAFFRMAMARFSTVPGECGADAERDVLGLALKFDDEDGSWDFVGKNSQTS